MCLVFFSLSPSVSNLGIGGYHVSVLIFVVFCFGGFFFLFRCLGFSSLVLGDFGLICCSEQVPGFGYGFFLLLDSS